MLDRKGKLAVQKQKPKEYKTGLITETKAQSNFFLLGVWFILWWLKVTATCRLPAVFIQFPSGQKSLREVSIKLNLNNHLCLLKGQKTGWKLEGVSLLDRHKTSWTEERNLSLCCAFWVCIAEASTFEHANKCTKNDILKGGNNWKWPCKVCF